MVQKKYSLMIVVCAVLAGTVQAQLLRPSQPQNPEEVWRQLISTSEEARRHGDYAAAEAACLKAVEMTKNLPPPDTHLAQSYGQLATIYVAQRVYDKAEKSFTDALHSSEAAVGPNHPMVSMALDSLAHCYFVEGKFEAALPLCERIVRISQSAVIEQNKDLARNKQLLAAAYFSAKQPDKGRAMMSEAIDLIHRCGDTDTEKQFHLMAGRTIEQVQDKAGALEHYKTGLALATATRDSEMAFQFEQAASDVYCAMNDYPAAEVMAKQALNRRESEAGANAGIDATMNVAICAENLGKVYMAWKRPDQAISAFTKAMEFSEKSNGAETGELAHFLANLADAEHAAGLFAPAAVHYERALAVAEKGGRAADLATVHEKYAAVLNVLNRSDDARKHLAMAKSLHETAATQPTNGS